jgi:predicted phage terminase large subunit-like protein
MTRWAKADPCGRILGDEQNPGPECADWFVFELLAAYDVKGTKYMLCPELLSEQRLERLRKVTIPEIFFANYFQQPIDIAGRLYKTLKTYTDIPRDDKGNPLFERIIAYGDTADDGADNLAVCAAGLYQGELYMLDVYYTKDGMETTEPHTAAFLHENKVNYALIESNNGGKGFARAVERLLWEKHQNRQTTVKWFHQNKNKKVRIIVNSNYVQEHIYFPVNWMDRWPDFYAALTTYQKEGKNKHDDGPDCVTGLAEILQKTGFGLGAVTVNL